MYVYSKNIKIYNIKIFLNELINFFFQLLATLIQSKTTKYIL